MEDEKGYIIVTPGTLLATSPKTGNGVYISDNKTYSKYLGILKKSESGISVLPFKYSYRPMVGDRIIGRIKEFNYPFFIVNMTSPAPSFLYLSDVSSRFMEQDELMQQYKPGTWIYAEISEISDRIKLSMKMNEAKKLEGGRMASVSPSKVPRIIGKNASMIKMIQEKTKTHILVGQNGIVWIKGDNAGIVVRAIEKISREAHISGLTDRISKFIDSELENGK